MTLNKNLMNLIVAAFVAAIFLTLASTSWAAEPRRVVVEIRGFKFVPQRPALAPGDIVVWINKDIVPHTVTAKDGSWDSEIIEVGKQWQTTIAPDMATNYFCAPLVEAVNGLVEVSFIPNIENGEVKALFEQALAIFKVHEKHAVMMVKSLED